MSFPRIAAIALAALLLSDLVAQAAGPLRPFKHGFWSGGAYTDDHTGAFTHCSAGVAYDSGIDLFMLVTGSYRWWLGFINPQWSLTANKKTPVRLQLDKAEPLERSATVPSGQLVLVPLPESARLLEELRHSSELTLSAQGRSFFFKLGDTAAVMDELTSCVRSSAAPDAHSAPPAPAAQPATIADSPGSTGSAAASSALQTSPAAADFSPSRPSHSKPAASAATATAAATQPTPPATAPPDRAATGERTPTAAGNATLPRSAAAGSPASSVPGATIGSAPGNSEPAGGTAAAGPGPAGSDGSPTPARSPPAQPAAEANASLPSASPPLSFTSVPSEKPPLPAAAPSAPSPSSFGPPEAASPTEREEMRLAREFLLKAQLPNARLVFTNKPPALASFAAVWQADDAAGAVKIIPPGPQVSAISIASNLIAVDPQVCKGNFATARSSASFDKGVVFSAVLSCTEANERRTTRYLVARRPRGGFVVFAVISGAAGGNAPPVRQEIDLLSKAAVEAAENQG